MLRVLTTLLVIGAAAEAATSSATLSISGTVAISSTAYTINGTATLTGGIAGSGTFSSTIPLASLTGANITAPFTITISGSTLGGTLTFPIALLEGPGSASLTISNATGSFSGDTGSFPSMNGAGSINTSTGSITLAFSGTGTITTGGTVVSPPPAITGVFDDASYTVNVAQGSLFVVKGTNMSASGYNPQPLPYPTSAGGTSITFTPAAGATPPTQVYIFYTYNQNGVNQIGGIIPSKLAVGSYNVTVTYNSSTSLPFATQVVAAKPGVFTQDTTGSGLASVQNIISVTQYDLNRLTTGSVAGTTISPGKPGQTLIAWATGLGAVAYPDNQVPPSTYNFPNVQVLVGGTAITPAYAGASGFAGLDQIVFVLPASITTGCTVTLQISVGGVLSSVTTIAIAPSNTANACVLAGYTTAQLQSLDQGGTITAGGFSLTQFAETVPTFGTVKIDAAGGGFTQVSGFELSSLPVTYSSNTIGSCTVIQVSISGGQVTASGTVTDLDAGTVTLSGPSGANLPSGGVLTETSNTYSLSIGDEGITGVSGLPNGTLVAGTYTMTGTGSTGTNGVGPFKVSINLGSPLTITGGLPSTVTRSQPLTLNWIGGNSTDAVEIIGYSGSSSGTGSSAVTTATEFICTTTAGPNTFTVPVSVLSQLPPTPAANGSGFLEVSSGPTPVPFSPSFAGGTITSSFSAQVGTGATVTYQ